MNRVVQWTESSRSGGVLNNMTGGEAQNFEQGFTGYSTGFDCPADIRSLPESAFCLLDCGTNGKAFASKTYLNGVFLGEVFSAETALRFAIPRRLLKTDDNELTIVFFGNFRMFWPDNEAMIEVRTDFDLTPAAVLCLEPFMPAGAVTSLAIAGQRVTLETRSGVNLEIRFPVDEAVRLAARRAGCNPDPLIDRLIPLGALPDRPCEVREESDTIHVQSATASLRVERSTGVLTLLRADGSPAAAFEVLTAGAATLLAWPLADAEALFGLGENTTQGMNKRGTLESIWVIHSFEQCDKPIPFLLSTAGYGLYLHSSYRAAFDLGRSLADRAACLVDHPGLEVVLFAHAKFPMMVRRFTEIAGRAPLPPRWAFGFWQSTTRHISQAELEANIERFEAEEIPLDVLAIDPNWQAPGHQSWKWDTARHFPDPPRFLQKLHAAKLELALWSSPFINQTSPLFADAAAQRRLMLEPDGSTGKVPWWMGHEAGLVDFANEDTSRWWGEFAARLAGEGIRVIKIDGGDSHETPPYLNSVTGRSMAELHNLYPVLFARSVYAAIQRADERALVWIRTGFTGIQQFPACWGGDQKADFSGGRVLIKAGQQAGLAGIPFWSHDLGGFAGTPTEEYYIRSFQWGLFSPLARAHGSITAPWNMTDRACRIVTRFIRLRYRLLPLLYSYAWHSHATGEPMMRAMVLDDQDDPAARTAEFQYRLGPDWLVAPIYQESGHPGLTAQRSVYLPAGTWWDYWTDQPFAGRQTLSVTAAIESLPLFVRGGALLLLGEPTRRASIRQSRLELHVYPGGDGALDYYEDDGRSQAYRRGAHAVTPIRLLDTGGELHLTIGPTEGVFAEMTAALDLTVVVHGRPGLAAMSVDGRAVSVERREGCPAVPLDPARSTAMRLVIPRG